MAWSDGEHGAWEVKRELWRLLGGQPVGVKGEEKRRFFANWGLNVQSLDHLPPLTLCQSPSEHCGLQPETGNHKWCARQKACALAEGHKQYVLRTTIDQRHVLLLAIKSQ